MLRITLLTLILLLPLSANADPITIFGGESEFSLAMGPDIHKDVGKIYGEFRYRETLYNFKQPGFWGKFGFSLYTGNMYTLGGDLYITHGSWMYGFGIEGAKRSSKVVDSTGGYELLIEYEIAKQFSVSLKHRSNCRQICRDIPFMPKGDEDLKNGGFNFLMLRYIF